MYVTFFFFTINFIIIEVVDYERLFQWHSPFTVDHFTINFLIIEVVDYER